MKSVLAVCAALLALSLAVPRAQAHHAFGKVFLDRVLTLNGTVAEFRWTQPHGWVLLDVQNPDATTSSWSIETAPPTVLSRRGWGPHTLARGQRVRLTIHPWRDGGLGGSLITAALPDGRVLTSD